MSNNKLSSNLVTLVAIFSLLGGMGGGALVTKKMLKDESPTAQVTSPQRVTQKSYVEESQVIDTAKKVSPSVVSIVISKDLTLYKQGSMPFDFDQFFNDPFGFQPFQQVPQTDKNGDVMHEKRQVGGGSGFIVKEDGLVVTNRHVVEDEDAQYTVVLSDGSEYDADVLARDTVNDFAVLQMKDKDGGKVSGLPVLSLGDSDSLQIGQRVVAIGNALAEFQNTVTTGIVSAIGRDITAGGSVGGSESLINLIQTDAAINPGNSGGPLVNLAGEVVAVNTAIAYGAQGIGFAIPVNDIKPLIQSVQENGKIIRAFLGVRYILLDEAKAKELKIDVDGGALLTGDEANGEFAVIPASPAEKAGLKARDVILEADGKKVTAKTPLQTLVANKAPGDKLKLKVWRSGEILELTAELGEAK